MDPNYGLSNDTNSSDPIFYYFNKIGIITYNKS